MKGWICYHEEDRQQLINLGVELTGEVKHSKRVETYVQQDCTLSIEVFLALEEHWGKFIWGLT